MVERVVGVHEEAGWRVVRRWDAAAARRERTVSKRGGDDGQDRDGDGSDEQQVVVSLIPRDGPVASRGDGRGDSAEQQADACKDLCEDDPRWDIVGGRALVGCEGSVKIDTVAARAGALSKVECCDVLSCVLPSGAAASIGEVLGIGVG